MAIQQIKFPTAAPIANQALLADSITNGIVTTSWGFGEAPVSYKATSAAYVAPTNLAAGYEGATYTVGGQLEAYLLTLTGTSTGFLSLSLPFSLIAGAAFNTTFTTGLKIGIGLKGNATPLTKLPNWGTGAEGTDYIIVKGASNNLEVNFSGIEVQVALSALGSMVTTSTALTTITDLVIALNNPGDGTNAPTALISGYQNSVVVNVNVAPIQI